MEPAWEWIKQNLLMTFMVVAGIVMIVGGGVWWWRSREPIDIEILGSNDTSQGQADTANIQVDVQGEVVKPGVYQLNSEDRIKDAIAAAGGMSANADRIWVARYVNLAQKVVDGAKIYIPSESTPSLSPPKLGGEAQRAEAVLNINSASQAELDGLTGIGETRAKAIVAGRPYGDIQELVSRKILPQSIFDKIKAEIAVY